MTEKQQFALAEARAKGHLVTHEPLAGEATAPHQDERVAMELAQQGQIVYVGTNQIGMSRWNLAGK